MGIGTSTTGIELATPVYTAIFQNSTSTTITTTVAGLVYGYYNFALYGTFVGTVRLEKSYDGGTTFIPVSLDTAGDYAAYTAVVSVTGYECERGVYYRFANTAYTSGTINCRLSSGDLVPTALMR